MNIDLEKLAEKILKLEKQCQSGKNVSKNMTQMEELMSGLSLEEMCELAEHLDTFNLKS